MQKRAKSFEILRWVDQSVWTFFNYSQTSDTTDTSCDVTMQVNGESLCLCDNVARFLVSSAIDFRL